MGTAAVGDSIDVIVINVVAQACTVTAPDASVVVRGNAVIAASKTGLVRFICSASNVFDAVVVTA
jgi:hypothetical protein